MGHPSLAPCFSIGTHVGFFLLGSRASIAHHDFEDKKLHALPFSFKFMATL